MILITHTVIQLQPKDVGSEPRACSGLEEREQFDPSDYECIGAAMAPTRSARGLDPGGLAALSSGGRGLLDGKCGPGDEGSFLWHARAASRTADDCERRRQGSARRRTWAGKCWAGAWAEPEGSGQLSRAGDSDHRGPGRPNVTSRRRSRLAPGCLE